MTEILGPDFELQEAVVTALRANADLQALLGSPMRLYDNVPNKPIFPYVTIGESQALPDIAECVDGTEIFLSLHIWSRSPAGFGEAKKISAAIWSVLKATTFGMTENKVSIFQRGELGDLTVRDPDGVTRHLVTNYRALCEPL